MARAKRRKPISIVVRRVAAGDGPALRALSAGWLIYCKSRGLPVNTDEAAIDAWIRVLAAHGDRLLFVAEHPKHGLIGAIFWYFMAAPFQPSAVAGMGAYVEEAYRRKGVGTALWKHAVSEARRLGAKNILIQVESENVAPCKVLKEIGFGIIQHNELLGKEVSV